MNRKSTLLLALSATISLAAAEGDANLSTEPQTRKVLLEEFTGVSCGNCPQGHKTAQNLQTAHEGEFFAVCIHAGTFAVNPYFNYIIDEGTEINDFFGISSYPSGIVNRSAWKDLNEVIGRNSWATAAREAAKTPSPVNISLSSTYDPATRLITARVDGYAVEAVESLYLSVMLLQSDILGIQSGGLLGDEYPHRHMLRATLNDDTMGDNLGAFTAGSSFTKTYTYTLPEIIGTVEPVVRDLQLLAFVAENECNVYTVAEAYPTVEGADEEVYASFAAPLLPIGANYGFDFIEVLLQNKGTAEITSAEFAVTINDAVETLRWEGSVPAHSSSTISIALNGFWNEVLDYDSNVYQIEMTAVNDIPYTTGADYVLKGKFSTPIAADNVLTFKIRTDNYAGENRFLLRDRQGNVVHEFGPYPDGTVTNDEVDLELLPGTVYCIEVTDGWGDGVTAPRGYVKWYGSDGKIDGQIDEITNYGARKFIITDGEAPAAIEEVGCDVMPDSNAPVYDLTGRRVSDTSAPGIYISKGRKIIVLH